MTTIAVIDHGAGNLVSIAQGLAATGATVKVIDTPNDIDGADGLVLPGVGATAPAMKRLERAGLVEPLRAWDGPLLGICVGLQVLFDSSEEDGARCLGLIPGTVQRLDGAVRLPHIGWNDVTTSGDPLFDGVPSGTPLYFVHSFAPVPSDVDVVIGSAEYGSRFVAAVRDRHRVGVQFHPERSGDAGLRILANFVTTCEEAARAA